MSTYLWWRGKLRCWCRHVHSYERMNRVYNYTVDPCGPIHVTVGDGGECLYPGEILILHLQKNHQSVHPTPAHMCSLLHSLRTGLGSCSLCSIVELLRVTCAAGNIEKLYTEWVDSPPSNCPAEDVTACPTRQNGNFCPVSQPDWSAFRYRLLSVICSPH